MRDFGFALLFIFVSVFIILVCAEVHKRLIDFMGSKKMTDLNKDIVLSSIYVPLFMIGVSIYVAVSEKFSKDIAGYELFLFVTPLLAVICLYTGAKAVRVNTNKMYRITITVVACSIFIAFISYLLIFRVFGGDLPTICSYCM